MPWLPFSCAAARMSLAASALGVVRGALVAGAVAQPGAAGPKAAGAPGGVLVTVLAAKVVHDLATAGGRVCSTHACLLCCYAAGRLKLQPK